jgi:hypothetical protein
MRRGLGNEPLERGLSPVAETFHRLQLQRGCILNGQPQLAQIIQASLNGREVGEVLAPDRVFILAEQARVDE